MPRKRVSSRLRSMTGFGRGAAKAGGVAAEATIRSVNQRFLRVGVKLPSEAASLEPCVRELIAGGTAGGAAGGTRRGQVDAAVTLEGGAAGGVPLPDLARVRRYVEAWREIADKLELPGRLDVGTLAFGSLIKPLILCSDAESGAAERARPAVEKAVRKALRALDRMRAAEGGRLAKDIRARLADMEGAAKRIGGRSEASKGEHAARLRARVGELVKELAKGVLGENGLSADCLDGERLAQEIVLRSCLHADRADVSEELERIASHIEQFRATLSAGSPAGRKLEFLVQELQREITTLGSKVVDVEAGREALEFRSELEKIREQVQNIE